MASFAEVFERKEQKYRLRKPVLERILGIASEHLQLGEYGKTVVRSLYYDTPTYDLIERSLDKPIYKEKLRLRVYGEPSPEAQAFVEIKKKFKGVVYKRRVPMSLAGADAYLSGMPYEEACRLHPLEDPRVQDQSLSPLSLQISREIDFLMSRHENLGPSMLIACDRDAFADPKGSPLRLTVDTNLLAKEGAASIADLSGMHCVIPQDEAILEIKNAGPMPLWLVDALSGAQAYPQSFSKYGTAYMKEKNCA